MTESIVWGALMDQMGETLQPLPAGEYDVRVHESSFVKSSNGKPMWKLTLKVVAGPHANRNLWAQIVLTQDNPNALRFFFNNMSALGLNREYFASSPSNQAIADALLNRTVRVGVKIRQWNGQDRNEVSTWKAAGAEAAFGGFAPPPGVAPAVAPATIAPAPAFAPPVAPPVAPPIAPVAPPAPPVAAAPVAPPAPPALPAPAPVPPAPAFAPAAPTFAPAPPVPAFVAPPAPPAVPAPQPPVAQAPPPQPQVPVPPAPPVAEPVSAPVAEQPAAPVFSPPPAPQVPF